MNPYPFVGLNHFTVPVAIPISNVDHAQYWRSPVATSLGIRCIERYLDIVALDVSFRSAAPVDEQKIGTIQRGMIDKISGKAAFAVTSF
jgi:hypothetical protein